MGRGSTVRRNQVVDTGGSTTQVDAYGILLYGPGVRALNNDISGTAATTFGNAFGLYLSNADGAVAEGNRITSATSGILYSISNGKYMNNLTSNVTTPFTNGTAVGTNN